MSTKTGPNPNPDTVTETRHSLTASEVEPDSETSPISGSSSVENAQVFRFTGSRKLGVTSSLFLILNKMIGTGSQLTAMPSQYFVERVC